MDASEHGEPHAFLTTAAAVVAGVIATAAATCCVLPLLLALVGLAGGWLAVLGPLVVHRELVLAATALPLVFAWARLVRSRRLETCCRRTAALPATITATGLWGLAIAAPWWEDPVTAVLFRWWTTA